MKKTRGFEVVEHLKDKEINLPVRGTLYSAGYDFEAAETMVIPSLHKTYAQYSWTNEFSEEIIKKAKPTMIPTGIRSYMPSDEYLALHARSSLCKKGLILANGVGVVDSDFYNNPQNHIHFPLWNLGMDDVVIEKGTRIGQGIFHKYALADQDTVLIKERVGGFGSSGE